nr:hypothetical protein L204_06024 [Cryptococcus depauperatus CBS 7855]
MSLEAYSNIISHLQTELLRQDVHQSDLYSCGLTVLELLKTVCRKFNNLFAVQSASSIQQNVNNATSDSFGSSRLSLPTISSILLVLFKLAKENINSIPFNLVPYHWLRLYTDVSILLSLHEIVLSLQVSKKADARPLWESVVKHVDMATIVAGAVGEGRQGWIGIIIEEARRRVKHTNVEPILKRVRPASFDMQPQVYSATSVLSSPLYAPAHIKILDIPPSITKYNSENYDQPFIIRGFLSDSKLSSFWPAIHRWKSVDYLLEIAGPGRVVPVETGRAYDDLDWGQSIVPFTEFLYQVGFHRSKDNGLSVATDSKPLYLAQYGLFQQFPELLRDITYPDYVWSSPPAPTSYPTYQPPKTEDGVILNVWVGSGNSEIISPAHTDPYFNCYAQVLGQKRVWLAPPSCSPYMYTYGSNNQSFESRNNGEGHNMSEQYMSNTSAVPILRPSESFDSLSLTFPAFFKEVWPHSREAVLNPGDILVMPPGWWHAMRGEGEEPVWSVSMWY